MRPLSRNRFCLLLACLLGNIPLGSLAKVTDLTELSLEDLMAIEVTSASKYAQSTRAAPSAVTVVTRDDIRRFGWRHLQDVLTAQRGFHGSYDRTYHYLGVRGFAPPGDYNNRIQFLIDGMRVNDNIYDSALAGEEFPLDIDLIERVEIVRGPGASLYGGNALFGIVNVITRRGDSVDDAEFAAEAGSRKARRLRATAGKTAGDVEWLLSVSGFDTRGGRYEFTDINAGVTTPDGADAERSNRLFARLRLGDWQGTLIHSQRKKHVPTGSYGTIPNDPAHREDDGYTLAELSHSRQLSAQHAYALRVLMGRYRYDSILPYDYSAAGGAAFMINRDTQRGAWQGLDARWTTTAWLGHRLVTGFEHIANTRQDQINADDDGTTYVATNDRSSRTALYAQDEWALTEQTTLMLGLRADLAEYDKLYTSPRLALVHQSAVDDTFKLLYGTGFRTPNAYERNYRYADGAGGFLFGNPLLATERMRSLEAVWERRLGEGMRFTGSLFRYTVSDPITLDTATLITINAAAVQARGIELEVERRWPDGHVLRGSYSGQFLRQNGQRPDNAPQGVWHLDAGLPLGADGWYAGIGLNALTARKAASGAAEVGGRVLADLNVSWRRKSSPWEFSAGLYNLFDKRYDDPAPPDVLISAPRDRFAQDGRSLRLKLVAGL